MCKLVQVKPKHQFSLCVSKYWNLMSMCSAGTVGDSNSVTPAQPLFELK